QRIAPAREFQRQMKMLVDIVDAEAKRRHGEKAVIGEKLAEMKQHLVYSRRHTSALCDGMIEHTVGAEPPVGDAQLFGIDPPDLDAQALRGASARHIDR